MGVAEVVNDTYTILLKTERKVGGPGGIWTHDLRVKSLQSRR